MANILIIDDKCFYRKKLKMILETNGHHIIGEAKNLRTAIALYEMLKPDLVTIDIAMDGSIGHECLKRIIKKDSKAKVVVVSGTNNKNDVISAMNQGAQHFILKSNQSQYINEKVNHVLVS